MKGLSFMPEMLRAFREGRKTITRRLVKRPRGMSDAQWEEAIPHNDGDGGHGVFGRDPYLRVDADELNGTLGQRIRCPQGIAGDRLYVKEALVPNADGLVAYANDGAPVHDGTGTLAWPWKPSKLAAMYCPRWASRDTIEIVSVRVERLHCIDEQDAIREGIEPIGFPRETFAKLWDSINGRTCPWSSNPFVWVLGFRRCA